MFADDDDDDDDDATTDAEGIIEASLFDEGLRVTPLVAGGLALLLPATFVGMAVAAKGTREGESEAIFLSSSLAEKKTKKNNRSFVTSFVVFCNLLSTSSFLCLPRRVFFPLHLPDHRVLPDTRQQRAKCL